MATLAYFLTWTTYGTWLPGDSRGWVNRHRTHGDVLDPPNPSLEAKARALLKDGVVRMDSQLRQLARSAMAEACSFRGWTVHAMAVRSNHVHVVVSARGHTPGRVMGTLKAYASRAMNAHGLTRRDWWTRPGSKRLLHNEKPLHAAIRYVQGQNASWMKGP